MYVGTKVIAHTGSTKFGTYKLVTGTVKGYEKRDITPTHYVLDFVIEDADGVEYRTTKSRIESVADETGTEEIAIVEAETVAPVEPVVIEGESTAVPKLHIGRRYSEERYGMRGTSKRPSDRVTRWTRRINGTAYEFSRVAWEGGRGGHTLSVCLAGTTTTVHEWAV
ncbi:hypothetical protein ACIBKZ_15730 [Streptomyces sp. NPDC050421]|uniref:hypothetical protein n=1 Tax=Streptomyces sp. NPDC050421 TaxID=3365613 RepID=UPI0037B22F79